MEDVENLVKSSLGEIEKLLSAKTVVGEPITIEGNTIIPLIAVGFGFGAGGSSGRLERNTKGEGMGGGTGGGAGMRPVAVIIVNKDGVRVESIKGTTAAVAEKVAEVLGAAINRRREREQEE